jgi:hypothetical protein
MLPVISALGCLAYGQSSGAMALAQGGAQQRRFWQPHPTTHRGRGAQDGGRTADAVLEAYEHVPGERERSWGSPGMAFS